MAIASSSSNSPHAPDTGARDARNPIASFTVSLGIAVLFFFSLAGSLSLWREDFLELFPASRYSVLCGVIIICLGLCLAKFEWRAIALDSKGFAFGLLVLFLTDWPTRRYNLLQGPWIRGEIILGALVSLSILRANKVSLFRYVLPLSILLFLSCFYIESGGRLLFSDDNPTFMYRLELLRRNFPFIPFYNPLWNAGIEARDFFATGALNVFFLFAPLIYLFGVFKTYNLLVVALLFGLMPASVWLASRLCGLRSPATAISALLALCSSLLWYRWALKYGTLGFITSASLVPLSLALLARILDRENEPRRIDVLLAIPIITLMLLWSPSGLVLVPALLLAALRAPVLIKRRSLWRFSMILLALNIPWIVLFWRVSSVGNFIKTDRPSYETMAEEKSPAYAATSTGAVTPPSVPANSFELRTAFKALRENSVSTNPLLVLLAIPALAGLRKRERTLWVASIVWLVALGTGVAQLKPQLELGRMLVIAATCLCIPVGAAIAEILREGASGSRWTIASFAAAVSGGFLLASPFATGTILLNRSWERYYFAQPQVENMASAIQNNVGDGRAFFTGFVLHELSHGHFAPLALLSGKPIVASSPFHDQWFAKEVFPQSALSAGDAGIQAYLDLMNATVVFAHDQRWQEYLLGKAEQFERIYSDSRFMAFKRLNYSPTYFISGQGEVIGQDSSSVSLRVHTEEAVIKFSYLPFLTASGCTLSGTDVGYGVRFIKLSNCAPDSTVVIHAHGPWHRILGETK